MTDLSALEATLDDLNTTGWPRLYLPDGAGSRSSYLPKGLESGHVYRGADGCPSVRLADGGDRLVFTLPDVGDSLVNPKGTGLRAIGLLVTYARGATYNARAFRAADLRKGRLLELRREPDNSHDRNAVAFYAPGSDAPLGYVQKARAPSVAKRMDKGEEMAAISLRGPGPNNANDTALLVVGSVADLLAMIGR